MFVRCCLARQFRVRSLLQSLPGVTRYENIVMYRKFATKNNRDIEDSETEEVEERITPHTNELMKVNLQRYEKALEHQEKAENYMREDNYEMAATAFASCIGTYNAYLEFKHGDNDASILNASRAELTLDPTIGLAFAQQCTGKLEEATSSYESALELMKYVPEDKTKLVRLLTNYAELLCHNEKPLLAIETINKALDKIENTESEIYAMAKSNLATYYAILRKYDVALPHSQEGYETFCRTMGKHNPYTESALRVVVRVLNELGRKEEAEDLQKEWEDSRKKSELPSSEQMEQAISEKVENSLGNFSSQKPMDPEEVVSPEVLEEQKKMFSGDYDGAEFGNPKFIEAITPELKMLYELMGRSKEFDSDIKRFKEDPEYAKEKLSTGLTSELFNMGLNEYYQSKKGLPKE